MNNSEATTLVKNVVNGLPLLLQDKLVGEEEWKIWGSLDDEDDNPNGVQFTVEVNGVEHFFDDYEEACIFYEEKKMERVLLAENVEIRVINEIRTVNIIRNENGNIVFEGIGSVVHEMLDDELTFMAYREGDYT